MHALFTSINDNIEIYIVKTSRAKDVLVSLKNRNYNITKIRKIKDLDCLN